jgi:hypothetical protein
MAEGKPSLLPRRAAHRLLSEATPAGLWQAPKCVLKHFELQKEEGAPLAPFDSPASNRTHSTHENIPSVWFVFKQRQQKLAPWTCIASNKDDKTDTTGREPASIK